MLTLSIKGTPRLLFVTGKGGVGKSLLTSALGLLFSRSNYRTLLVEMNDSSSIPPLFGKRSFRYRLISLEDKLFHISINKYNALEEYLLLQIRSTILYRLLFKNRVMKRVIDVAPAISELFTLGKIWDLLNEKTERGDSSVPRFDILIIDAPSTGHCIGLFKTPFSVMDIVRAGPIYNECKKVTDLISDPMTTGIIVVTMPEEMAINETLYLCKRLRVDFDLPLKCIIMNQYLNIERGVLEKLKADVSRLPEKTIIPKTSFLQCIEMFEERVKRQEFYINEISKEIDHPLILSPFVPQMNEARNIVKCISESLSVSGMEGKGFDSNLFVSILKHPLTYRTSLL